MEGKNNGFNSMQPYDPPKWSKCLRNVPTHKVELAHANTPIHDWEPPGTPRDIKLSIKRDDLTGSALSGNKIRKLEFLIADALQQGCKHIIACGTLQSNQCRATAVACRHLGLKTHLVLLPTAKDVDAVLKDGNAILYQLTDAKIYLAPKDSSVVDLKNLTLNLTEKIRRETSEKSYIAPFGGSSAVGIYGYINCFEELIQQGLLEEYDDIVCAVASGCTIAGLAVGNYLNGSKIKCHAVIVAETLEYHRDYINNMFKEIGLDIESTDVIDFIDGYMANGYCVPSVEVDDYILDVSTSTGILLDPVYSGKAAWGFSKELKRNPDRFQGKRILFLHTGGIFSMYCDSIRGRLTERSANITTLDESFTVLENGLADHNGHNGQ